MIHANDVVAFIEQYQQQGGDMGTVADAVQLLSAAGKTSLGLNQWVKSDKPLMEDFNEDNRIIDAELCRLNESKRMTDKDLRRLEAEKADYEEGEWTPTPNGGLRSFDVVFARYFRTGKKVLLQARLDNIVLNGTGNAASILGAPWPVMASGMWFYGQGVIGNNALMPQMRVQNNSEIRFYLANAAPNTLPLLLGTTTSSGDSAQFTIEYVMD